jgi:hypothetical protein
MHVERITSTRHLRRLYKRSFGGLSPREVQELLDYEFPPPPFSSDDPSFQFIDDALGALEESAEMGPN